MSQSKQKKNDGQRETRSTIFDDDEDAVSEREHVHYWPSPTLGRPTSSKKKARGEAEAHLHVASPTLPRRQDHAKEQEEQDRLSDDSETSRSTIAKYIQRFRHAPPTR